MEVVAAAAAAAAHTETGCNYEARPGIAADIVGVEAAEVPFQVLGNCWAAGTGGTDCLAVTMVLPVGADTDEPYD